VIKEDNVLKIQTGSAKISYSATLKVYHRCLNIFNSDSHELPRPWRVLSFCVQMMTMLMLLGVFTHYITTEDSWLDLFCAYVLGFFILRIMIFVLNKILLIGYKKPGCLRVLVLIIVLTFFVTCHWALIHAALIMETYDFLAWNVGFFVVFILDVIVWELVVNAWQTRQLRKINVGDTPMMKKLVSKACMTHYGI
jgi:hypothetical protein